jgi:two-component system, sporulation sensor kinase E
VMPKGGELQVRIRKESGNLLIGITDQGPVISDDMIEKLGQPFYSTKEKGTGLGLMVSFKIIELHGGKINISSEIDKGATFEVQLPAL